MSVTSLPNNRCVVETSRHPSTYRSLRRVAPSIPHPPPQPTCFSQHPLPSPSLHLLSQHLFEPYSDSLILVQPLPSIPNHSATFLSLLPTLLPFPASYTFLQPSFSLLISSRAFLTLIFSNLHHPSSSSSQPFPLLSQSFSSFLPTCNRLSVSTHPAFLLLPLLHHLPSFSIFLHSMFHFLNLIHRFSLPTHPVISPHADSTPSPFIEVFSFPFLTLSWSFLTVCITIHSLHYSLSLRDVSVPGVEPARGGEDVRMSSMFAWGVYYYNSLRGRGAQRVIQQ